MKNKNLTVVMAVVAVLALNQNLQAGSAANRAVLAAPRTIEEFPGLAIVGSAPRHDGNRYAEALPASPRSLELFPELSRVGVSSPMHTDANIVAENYSRPISSRAIEETPALRWVNSAPVNKPVKTVKAFVGPMADARR